MFRVLDIEEIFSKFPKRDRVIEKSKKIDVNDKIYWNFVSFFGKFEINPDSILLDYDQAILENLYIQRNFSAISDDYWLFGRTGQGDEWFIEKKDKKVFFYNHEIGNYETAGFLNMQIDFAQFLQLSFLIKELEEISEQGKLSDAHKRAFISSMDTIQESLFTNYPYRYFD
jgi:hypothetical protein